MTGARVATTADLDEVARTLALAFADDPVIAYLFGDGETCDVDTGTAFFRIDARNHLPHGHCYVTEPGGGASLWAPPGRWKTTPRQLARSMPGLLRILPLRRLPRTLRFLGTVEEAHPTEPHWYLAVLGSEPAHRGEGLGQAAMAPVLDRADRDGTPCYLESSKEANIPYYERAGFRVTGTIEPDGAPPLWSMWRPPGG